MRRFRGWTSASLTAALLVVAGGVLTSSAASSAATAFVPITPCRLFDTRPGTDNVGTRSTPLAADETYTVPAWGANGKCTLPTGITGLSMNVTIVSPTGSSFLTVWPADKDRPLAASLNWVPGQDPTPNAVTAALSPTGTLSFYNLAGSVHLAVDVVGYYEPTAGGPPGPAGPAGPRGYSAWDTIPSGLTVSGLLTFDAATTGDTGSDYLQVDLPGLAPVALTDANVNFGPDAFAATIDDDASCTGTYTAPTAPAGKVCLYVSNVSGMFAASGYAPAALRDHGFQVGYVPKSPGVQDLYLYATWAYRAP